MSEQKEKFLKYNLLILLLGITVFTIEAVYFV